MPNQYGESYYDKMPKGHTNAFLNINNIPYLLAEYPDKSQFRQIDRSYIKSEIHVDHRESMRAIIDINIDDIGTRSDGLPNIVGNRSQIDNLIKIIGTHADRLQHRLDVIRNGLIVRINYRLENQRTRQVIRSTSEDLRIRDRNYFLDINPRDINDNGVIINFSDSIVSTLTEFTHGTDRMLIRVTSIQLFYECLKRDSSPLRPFSSTTYSNGMFPDLYDEYLSHHKYFQNRHVLGIDNTCNCDEFNDPNIMPPSWNMFNRFYRFDNMGRDIMLHGQEINDRNNRVYTIPCGSIMVNRQFMINPGHRIIFKLSIWKNDLVSVENTQSVASALGVHCLNEYYPPRPPKPPINPDMEQLIRLLMERQHVDHRQNHQIKVLMEALQKLLEDKENAGKPDVPTNIFGSALRDGTINISWLPVDGADGYNLMCDVDDEGFEIIYTGTDPSFTHSGLTPGKIYTYKVNSFIGEKMSDYSVVINVTSRDPLSPGDCDCDDIEPITDERLIEILKELGLYP